MRLSVPVQSDSADDDRHVESIEAVSIENWLDIFTRLLRLPPDERSAVRAELEAHLRERVRDLMIKGDTETQAVQTATSELGETATLARSFRSAHHYPRRRLIMNLSLIGLGLASVSIGAMLAFAPAPQPNSAIFPGEAHQQFQSREVLQNIRLDIGSDMTFRNLVDEIVHADDGIGVSVDWDDLQAEPDEPLGVTARATSVASLLEVLRDRYYDLGWRVRDEMLVLGAETDFLIQESRLVTYDIAPPVHVMRTRYDMVYETAVERITTLLEHMVQPEQWENMGGRVARYQVVGGKLFIEAPPAMHERIAWILDQLERDHAPHAAATAAAAGHVSIPPADDKLVLAMRELRGYPERLALQERGFVPEERGQGPWMLPNLDDPAPDQIIGFDRWLYFHGSQQIPVMFGDHHVEAMPLEEFEQRVPEDIRRRATIIE